MKKLLLVWFWVVLALPAIAQKKHRTPHVMYTAETKLEKYNCQCVHRNTYTTAQRLKFYPFNKAAKIELISYNGGDEPNQEVMTDSIIALKKAGKYKPEKIWKSPFKRYKVDTSMIMQTVTLSKTQVNKLTDLLFNIAERKHDPRIAYPGYSCFEPRNAIIFKDGKGKIFAYIEICFECEQIETMPRTIGIGPWCLDKMNKIKQYLKLVGIKYGVTTLVLPPIK